LQNATNHVVEECNPGIDAIRNMAAQCKQSSPLTRVHRNDFSQSLVWYAECLTKSVKREATKALAEQEALGCEAGGGYDSSSSSHDVRNLPNH
jgi:hypothetical protein